MRSGIGICRADERYGLLGTGLTSAKGIRGRSGKTLQGKRCSVTLQVLLQISTRGPLGQLQAFLVLHC